VFENYPYISIKIQNYAQENPHRSTMHAYKTVSPGASGSSLFHSHPHRHFDSGSLRLLYCSLNFPLLPLLRHMLVILTFLPGASGVPSYFPQEDFIQVRKDFMGTLNPKKFWTDCSYGLIQSNKPVSNETDYRYRKMPFACCLASMLQRSNRIYHFLATTPF